MNCQLDVVYTDFSKAFDRVSHKILVRKLEALGFHPLLLKWLNSYLCNRLCSVSVNGINSDVFIATSGVPQGSILGPLLFLLFINDIPDCFKYSNCLLYADDLKLFRIINNQQDTVLLQSDLNNLLYWCSKNFLSLNVLKCNVVSYTRSKYVITSSYSLSGHTLVKLDIIRDLGIVFDSKLSFAHHLNYVIPKAYAALSFVRRHTTSFRDPYTLISLYNSLVRSILEYGSIIWCPATAVHISRIERVQKSFTRMALKTTHFSNTQLPNYTSRCLLLGLMSLENRRSYLALSFIYKLINGLVDCPFLLQSINFSIPTRELRNTNVFSLPIVKSNFASNEPIHRALYLYNKLSRLDLVDFSWNKSTFKYWLTQSITALS